MSSPCRMARAKGPWPGGSRPQGFGSGTEWIRGSLQQPGHQLLRKSLLRQLIVWVLVLRLWLRRLRAGSLRPGLQSEGEGAAVAGLGSRPWP